MFQFHHKHLAKGGVIFSQATSFLDTKGVQYPDSYKLQGFMAFRAVADRL
jgi:hypothetical protein